MEHYEIVYSTKFLEYFLSELVSLSTLFLLSYYSDVLFEAMYGVADP
jgi:hypothetical protein